jgi:hypothetical protein
MPFLSVLLQLAREVRHVRLAGQEHGQPRRLLARQPELQILVGRALAGPVVVDALEGDRQAGLAVHVAVHAGARRALVESLLAFLVPLRLADHAEVAGARHRVQHRRGRPLHPEHDLVVVEDLTSTVRQKASVAVVSGAA